MQRHRFTAGFAIAVNVLFGLARSATAAEPVPFRGDLEGMRVSSTPLEAPYVLNTSIVAGNATQLGSYQLTITLVVNTANRTSLGTYEFVASNGDTLTAAVAGTAETTPTPGVTSIVEVATVTGGTGRFEGATGDIVCTRLGNPSGITVGTFDGSISTPGAN